MSLCWERPFFQWKISNSLNYNCNIVFNKIKFGTNMYFRKFETIKNVIVWKAIFTKREFLLDIIKKNFRAIAIRTLGVKSIALHGLSMIACYPHQLVYNWIPYQLTSISFFFFSNRYFHAQSTSKFVTVIKVI